MCAVVARPHGKTLSIRGTVAAIRRKSVALGGHLPDTLLPQIVALTCLRPPGDSRAARCFKEILLDEESAAGGGRPAPSRWIARLAGALGIPDAERAARIAAAGKRAEEAVTNAARAGLVAVPWYDERYPPLLRELIDPPIVLWLKGRWDVLHVPAIAIVGARNATPTGLRVAREIAGGLAAAGLTIVSGLARGIDAAAHHGALEAQGTTAAVLGCGADEVYPPENAALSSDVARSGALVSEFLPGTRPLAHHFPLRNRIVSGLARAVVVIEASDRSGSLITARTALEQGRDVFAVPGNVLSGASRGCHALIKDGAGLVETVTDVLNALGWAPSGPTVSEKDGKSLEISDLERQMAVGESYVLDELAAKTGRAAGDILAELSGLELAGRVQRLPGGNFARLDS